MSRAARATAAFLLALGTPIWADPPPKPMSLQVIESMNRHGEGGGTSRRFHSTVTLELLPGGQLRLEDQGTASDRVIGGPSFTETKTSWKAVWRGSWTMTAQTLGIELESVERKCETAVTSGHDMASQAHTKKSPCPPVASSASLECSATHLQVDAVRESATDRKSRQAVWRCRLKDGSAKIGGTPLGWVFGKSACIETSPPERFGSERSYRLCSPSK